MVIKMPKESKINTNVRLPRQHRRFLEEKAEKNGESLSEFLRSLVNAYYKTEKTLDKLEESKNEL